MSKRSTRMLAVIAGAALALGSMAPAIAQRDDDDDVNTNAPSTQQLDCLTGLAGDLFPVNVLLDPEDSNPLVGLLDVAIGDETPANPFNDGGTHVGLPNSILPPYGVANTVDYILSGLIGAGACLTDEIVDCVVTNVADLFPINVLIDPEDSNPALGLVDVSIGDETPGTLTPLGDGTHLGVLGELGAIYGVANSTGYVLAVIGEIADCLLDGDGLPNFLACLGSLPELFPINVLLDPEDSNPFFGLLDVSIGDDTPGTLLPLDGTHLGLFGELGNIYGVGFTLNYLLGETVGCLLDELAVVSPFGMAGLGGGLLSPVSGLTGLGGGSPLGLVGGLVDLVGGTALDVVFSVTGIVSPSGLDASILSSVAASL